MPHREDFTQIQAGRPIIYYAVRGNPLNSASQAGVWGISKMIDTEFPAITRADSGMEPYTDAQEIKIKFESMQTTYVAIKRAILLAQTLQTVIVNFGLDFYNFVDPYDLGMEMTLDVSSTDIILTIEYHGKVTPAQWDAVLAAGAAAIPGGTGGSTITDLDQQAFSDDEYGIPGIEGIYIGTGTLSTDDELGLKEAGGSKLQIKLAGVGNTMRLQPISKKIEIKNTIAIFENRRANLVRNAGFRNTEKVITWVLSNGTTIVFDKCTKLSDGLKISNGSGMVELKNEGSTYTDPLNSAQVNIVFDDANQKITFHKQGVILP